MGMYEIEGVVIDSVSCIDNNKDLKLQDKRNIIHSLYEFQKMFDTGYTYFRVYDILKKYHYLISIPIDKHPDYEELKPRIEEAKRNNETWFWLDNESLIKDIGKEDNGKPLFHIVVGSSIWKKLVDSGVIEGEEKQGVTQLPWLDMVDIVVCSAKEQKNTDLSAQWYDTMIYLVSPDLEYCDEPTETDLLKIEQIRENILFDETVYPLIEKQYAFSRGALDFLKQDTQASIQLWIKPYIYWLENH